MIIPEEPKKKGNLLERLPRLGKTSLMLLIAGIFLILFIPLAVIYQQQPPKQAEMKHELSLLQKILAVPETKKEALKAQTKKVEAEAEAALDAFPKLNQSLDIIDELLELAELNDIVITYTATTAPAKDARKATFPELTFEVHLTGQVPKFQNFILAIDDRFPTSQLKTVDIAVAEDEGEEDKAVLKIEISCYEGS